MRRCHEGVNASATARLAAMSLLVALPACMTDRPVAPAGLDGVAPAPTMFARGSELTVTEGGRALRAAQIRHDSTGAALLVARLRVHGEPGDSITLRDLRTGGAPSHPGARISATIRGISRSLTQIHLGGKAFYGFAAPDTVTVEYRLSVVGPAVPNATLRLVHQSAGSSELLSVPWAEVSQQVTPTAGPSGTTCSLTAATGACASVTWGIDPYAPGFVFPGFQSDAGSTGPSRPITITFSSQIASATVTAHDPTWAGNQLVGYDGSAIVASATFAGSGQAGVNVPSTRTVTGNITRVVLIPAPNDYVTYQVSVLVDAKVRLNVNCTPSPVTRGATVMCTATLSNGKAFSVVIASVDDPERSPRFISGAAINAGKGWQTQGPGLYSTYLSISAISSGSSYPGTGYVTVAPRTLPPMAFPALPTSRSATALDGPVFVDFHLPNVGMRFGEFRGPEVDTATVGDLPIIVATSGPSEGYFVIASGASVPLKRPEVVLNPTFLRAGPFFRDQNGTDGFSSVDPVSNMPYCNNATDPTWIDRVEAFVRRHEGVTGDPSSHFGLFSNALATLNPQGSIESLLFLNGTSSADVRRRVHSALKSWALSPSVSAPHTNLDDTESTPAAFNAAAQCALDRNLVQERGQ